MKDDFIRNNESPRFDLNFLRKTLRDFDENGMSAQNGHWSIGRGGYDQAFELYYDNRAVLDAIAPVGLDAGELEPLDRDNLDSFRVMKVVSEEYPEYQASYQYLVNRDVLLYPSLDPHPAPEDSAFRKELHSFLEDSLEQSGDSRYNADFLFEADCHAAQQMKRHHFSKDRIVKAVAKCSLTQAATTEAERKAYAENVYENRNLSKGQSR